MLHADSRLIGTTIAFAGTIAPAPLDPASTLTLLLYTGLPLSPDYLITLPAELTPSTGAWTATLTPDDQAELPNVATMMYAQLRLSTPEQDVSPYHGPAVELVPRV